MITVFSEKPIACVFGVEENQVRLWVFYMRRMASLNKECWRNLENLDSLTQESDQNVTGAVRFILFCYVHTD